LTSQPNLDWPERAIRMAAEMVHSGDACVDGRCLEFDRAELFAEPAGSSGTSLVFDDERR
jgi:hypothetical protein